MSGLQQAFDQARHPRNEDGRFVSQRGRQAIIRALPALRGHSGPSMSPPAMREASPGPERRSNIRTESWQRIGNKIAALPIDYTGNRERERPVGSYLHLTLNNQIPKSVPVEDHQAKVKRFIAMANENRKPIIEAATKARAGKKHVYLKAHEPAARGVARWRMKPDKFPEGTTPETLHRAYNHAALLAMHDRGLVDYDFKMDDALKAELKPTEPFIRYARTQISAKANEAMPGVKQEQMQHFGQSWTDQHGRPRKRFRPNQQLIKAAPIGAFARRVAGRAASALDSVAESTTSQHEAADAAATTISRAKRFFGPKQPGAVNRAGYTLGRGTAAGIKRFARNPIRAVKAGVIEGARGGSGFAQGVSDGFGGSARTRRIAGRIGAVSGALKVPVIAGAIAAKPVSMAYNEMGGGNSKNKSSG